MSREDNPSSAAESTTNKTTAMPQQSNTLGSLFALTASMAVAGLALFGLHKVGEQERGVSAKAEDLLARGQRFVGNKDDAARTRAHTFAQNVAAGAKKVAGEVEDHTSTAVAVVSGCLGGR